MFFFFATKIAGRDISIINTETWIKIGRPLLKKTEKVAHGISGRKLHFQGEFSCNISFVGKTLKSKVYVLQNASNLLEQIGFYFLIYGNSL